MPDTPRLVPVESPDHRAAAERLVGEYLRWVAEVARTQYDLTFDVDAMLRSDIDDTGKFYPPNGRFYLVEHAGAFVGVGCLKRLGDGVGEVQRMYVQSQVRGVGAGRMLVRRLLDDARAMGLHTVRLESMRALTPAHALYRSVGFVDIEPYSTSNMQALLEVSARERYRASTLFMEVRLGE